MRTVLRNAEEVAHVWASRSQPIGRAGNMNFDGDTIYSHGWWPMAQFVGKTTVLVRDWIYSPSTGRHMRYMRGAIPMHYRVIEVGDPGRNGVIPHSSNVSNFLNKINQTVEKFTRSRLNKRYYYNDNQRLIADLKEYCKAFKLKVPKHENMSKDPHYAQAIETQDARNLELEASAKERHEKRQKALEKKHAPLLEEHKRILAQMELDWVNGISNETRRSNPIKNSKRYRYWDTDGFSQTRIRITKDGRSVESNLHAYVPVDHAKKLWERIKNNLDIKGQKVGSYTVIGMNGTLKIGCHEITKEEMERFVTKYGW